MQQHHLDNLNEFLNSWDRNHEYFRMLALMASLSKLFSESAIPYLDYRLAENLFCKYFNAVNDARSCTAYDARLGSLGIGIKTFTLKSDESLEKIAEFNRLRPLLEGLKGIDLARRLAEFRNERMRLANDIFNVGNSIYHIVGRKEGFLRIFNVPYETIDIDSIRSVKDNGPSLHFEDDHNAYSFNKSKSVLLKRFKVPALIKDVPISILEDPLSLLETLLQENLNLKGAYIEKKGVDYVVLPLYSTRTGEVPEKSGLNQWNADGRKRHENELYIPVPIDIRRSYPDFFPDRETPFTLILPDGKKLTAKICQAGGKALMSNPNSDLGEWLLRKILRKPVGQIVTKEDLDIMGVDSIIVYNKHHQDEETGLATYSIAFNDSYGKYSDFIEE